jgi:short-subunit dehydrogenase
MTSHFFKDKIIWITGASSGIGEALVYEFSKQEAKLIISSRDELALDRVKRNCSNASEDVFILPFDLTDQPDIEAKTILALNKWGSVDYLILNAGIAARDFAENTDMSVFRMVMDTNYFGPVALTKAVLPSMLLGKKGHIIVVSSLSGKFGVPKLSAYAGSKHALHGFFESLRMEIRKTGVTISIIIPGFINTPILMKAMDGSGNISGKNLSVNEKGMSPEECASRMVKAIRKGKQETLIGGSESLSVYFHRFFPGTFNLVMASHPLKRIRNALPRFFK